jgi:hypothetical protein
VKVDVEITESPSITLDIHICAERRGYRVTWEGRNIEARVIAFLDSRRSTHAFHEVEDAWVNGWIYPELFDYMYPQCEHGMLLTLCYGPGHYPPDNY